MKSTGAHLVGAFCAAAILGSGAQASETTTYSYDPLGRLVGVSTSGGQNNGLSITTSYDAAGNRTAYVVAGAGGLAANSGPNRAAPIRLSRGPGGSGVTSATNLVSFGYSR